MSKAATLADTEESTLRPPQTKQVKVNFESCTSINTRVLPMLSSDVERPHHTQTCPNLDSLANAPGGDGENERAPENGKRTKALSECPCESGEEWRTAKMAKTDCIKQKAQPWTKMEDVHVVEFCTDSVACCHTVSWAKLASLMTSSRTKAAGKWQKCNRVSGKASVASDMGWL